MVKGGQVGPSLIHIHGSGNSFEGWHTKWQFYGTFFDGSVGSRIPNETHWYTIFWGVQDGDLSIKKVLSSKNCAGIGPKPVSASVLQQHCKFTGLIYTPLQCGGTCLCGARECAIISTIVKPLSASNDCPREDRPLLWMRLDFCLTLFKSGLAPEEASGPGGRQIVFSQCQLLRCLRILLLEWLTMMAALRNYSAWTFLLGPSLHCGIERAASSVLFLYDWPMWTGQLHVSPWLSGAKARTGFEEDQIVLWILGETRVPLLTDMKICASLPAFTRPSCAISSNEVLAGRVCGADTRMVSGSDDVHSPPFFHSRRFRNLESIDPFSWQISFPRSVMSRSIRFWTPCLRPSDTMVHRSHRSHSMVISEMQGKIYRQIMRFSNLNSSVRRFSLMWSQSTPSSARVSDGVMAFHGPLTSPSMTCLHGHFLSPRILSSWRTWVYIVWVTDHKFAFRWLQTRRWSSGKHGSSSHMKCFLAVLVVLGGDSWQPQCRIFRADQVSGRQGRSEGRACCSLLGAPVLVDVFVNRCASTSRACHCRWCTRPQGWPWQLLATKASCSGTEMMRLGNPRWGAWWSGLMQLQRPRSSMSWSLAKWSRHSARAAWGGDRGVQEFEFDRVERRRPGQGPPSVASFLPVYERFGPRCQQ